MSALSETVVDPSTSAVTRLTVRPLASVSRRSTWALVISSTLACSSAGSTQITWASDLALSRQGNPSTRSQRMHLLAWVAPPRSSWVRSTPIGRWNGCRPCFSRSSLSCWIRGSCCTGGSWYWALAGPFGGVLAVVAVDEVQVLGLGVVRLEVVVADRPGRRQAAVVPDLAEVLGPQAEQRRAVELRVPADVVVDLGRELVAVPVVPELRRAVLAAHEHRGGVPVVALTRQVVAPLEQQDPLARRRQPVGQGPSSRSRADHDDVVVLVSGHPSTVDA